MIAYNTSRQKLNSLNELRREFREVARRSNKQKQRFLPERDKQWPNKTQVSKPGKRKRSIDNYNSKIMQSKRKKQQQRNAHLYRHHPYNNEEERKNSEIAMVLEMVENNFGDLTTFTNMVTQFIDIDDNTYASVDYTKLIEVQESKEAKGVDYDNCNNNETNKCSSSNHASQNDRSSTTKAAKTISTDTIRNKSIPAYVLYTYNHDARCNASDEFTSREEEYIPHH
jgi:hypothetical protein